MTGSVDVALEAKRKEDDLRRRLRAIAPVVVALSGGADSTYLLSVAAEEDPDGTIAAVGVSPSLAGEDLDVARSFAREIGVSLREVETRELDDPHYTANAGDRCLHCKTELFRRISEETRDVEACTVVDGTNASDLVGDRPGLVANARFGVVSPLREAGLTKDEIRSLSRRRALPTWDKPEAACLASRIPVGTRVTADALGQVEAAERALRAILGRVTLRVRHEGRMARIETAGSELARVLSAREAVVAAVRGVGYDVVVLDLAGYSRPGGAPHGTNDRKIAARETPAAEHEGAGND